MRSLLLSLLLLTAAMAGCTGSDDAEPNATVTDDESDAMGNMTHDDSPDDGAMDHDAMDDGSDDKEPADDSEEAGPNTPPTASLGASIQNGEAPVEVEFTLDGTDADGDNLTWSFDADEDGIFDAEGTELPATVNFTYAAEGVFNATLTVRDSLNETTAALQIDVTAPSVEEGFAGFSYSGYAPAPCPLCLGAPQGSAGFNAGQDGVDSAWTAIPAAAVGHTAVMTNDWGFVSYHFLDSCEATATAIGGSVDEDSGVEVVIPAGTACVQMFDYTFPDTTMTLDIV